MSCSKTNLGFLMESAVTVRRALFGHSRAIIVGLSGPAGWGIREARGGVNMGIRAAIHNCAVIIGIGAVAFTYSL